MLTFDPTTLFLHYMLLKSNVTTWSVGDPCRGSQECGSRFVNFIGDGMKSSALRITLKSTTLVHVRSRLREPGNHDNGASDVWALTAYFKKNTLSVFLFYVVNLLLYKFRRKIPI